MRRLAQKLGANYLWGLVNFTFGVAAGSFYTGFVLGLT
jgi:hypothetical protein